MADNNFTIEQLEAAKMCKSPEELVGRAKEQGIDITLGQAAAFLDDQTAELADEELDNVAGGGMCGSNNSTSEEQRRFMNAAYADGRFIKVTIQTAYDSCSKCRKNASMFAREKKYSREYAYNVYYDIKCYHCNGTFKELSDYDGSIIGPINQGDWL